MMATAAARAEFQARQERERQKALEKYGDVALRPAGHPDYDVLDYLINEVVGLVRYGQMLRARMMEIKPPERDANVDMDGHAMGLQVSAWAEQMGPDLIDLRHRLLAAGVVLGAEESRGGAARSTLRSAMGKN